MEFRTRLQKATERGHHARDEKLRREQAARLSEQESKRLHASYRRQLTDHIESCLEQLADNVPGFRFEPVMDEKGWGAAVSRDDVAVLGGRRQNETTEKQPN